MLQIPDAVQTWAADRRYMGVEGAIFVKYYSKIPSRYSWVSFDTKYLKRKDREIQAPLSFMPDKEKLSFI